MSATVSVTARLRVPDGREFAVSYDQDARYADVQRFWWTDGNGACDCNRSLYLNRQHGLMLGERDEGDDVACLPCGGTIALVALSVSGVQVYAE